MPRLTPPPNPRTPEPPGATRTALLDAAERLFSENGVEATSVRQIIAAARANLGAINYHFGTKERLALEVFARRLEPVNRERVARLDALEAEADGQPVLLAAIVEAIVRPAVEGKERTGAACDDFMRLMSRSFQEPNAEVKKFVEQQFAGVAQRFDAAILRAVPSLPPRELFWCMNFAFGALHHGLETWLRFEHMPHPAGPKPARPDREEFIQRLVAFMVAGLAAPEPRAAAPSDLSRP